MAAYDGSHNMDSGNRATTTLRSSFVARRLTTAKSRTSIVGSTRLSLGGHVRIMSPRRSSRQSFSTAGPNQFSMDQSRRSIGPGGGGSSRKKSTLRKTVKQEKWREAYSKVLHSLKIVKLMGFSGDSIALSPLAQLSRDRNLTARASQVGLSSILGDDSQSSRQRLSITKLRSVREGTNFGNALGLGSADKTREREELSVRKLMTPSPSFDNAENSISKKNKSPTPVNHLHIAGYRDPDLKAKCVEILTKKCSKERSIEDLTLLQELVKEDKFFQNLTPSVRIELCRVMRFIRYDSDMIVFKQGDEGVYFYIILQGRVSVHIDKNDLTVTANELVEGQSFGELALANEEPRTATIMTRDACDFLVISKHDYRKILDKLQRKDVNEKIACFARLPYFSTWDKIKLTGLVKACKLVKIPANFVVCKQDEPVTHLYIVKRGTCRIIKRVRVPETSTLEDTSITAQRCALLQTCFVNAEFLNEGGFFGENGLLGMKSQKRKSMARLETREESTDQETSAEPAKALLGATLSTKTTNNHQQHPPGTYQASMVSERDSEILAVRLSDFVRFTDKASMEDLLSFAVKRDSLLAEECIRRKLCKQIQWESEKQGYFMNMRLPKFQRFLAEKQMIVKIPKPIAPTSSPLRVAKASPRIQRATATKQSQSRRIDT